MYIAKWRPRAQPAEHVREWVLRHLPDGPKPSIYRPPNYVRIISITIILLGSVTFISVAWPYVLPFIQNRNLWAAVSLITILLFTSGHMFNHIRKVPYVAGDGRGGVSYFAGGFSNQYGLESQIVAAMCKSPTCTAQRPGKYLADIDGILSFATIALALKVPRMVNAKSQQVAVFLWGGVMLLQYSFLLNVFRIKNGGYPFHLPPF